MTYPATTYAEGVELTITSGNQLHEIINGDATEEISTESGMVPSVRKALADAMLFKPAIAWSEGSVESDPFQTRLFGEGIYWAPAASNETPISMGNNPTTDSNWFLAPVTGGESISRNTNLLSNHNFIIQSPDDITHPSVTPTDYVAGTQIFSGVFVGDDIVGLTYVDGRVSWTSGTLYFSVHNSGALEYVDETEFVASVADFDGKPRNRGVSFALVGDEYRVTVGIDALSDGVDDTLLGSVKFEQGKVATGHETESLSSRNLSDYTDIVYKASGGNSAVENMIEDATLNVGDTCSTGGTVWQKINDNVSGSTLANKISSAFTALTSVCGNDFGAVGDYYVVNLTTLARALGTENIPIVNPSATDDSESLNDWLSVISTPRGGVSYSAGVKGYLNKRGYYTTRPLEVRGDNLLIDFGNSTFIKGTNDIPSNTYGDIAVPGGDVNPNQNAVILGVAPVRFSKFENFNVEGIDGVSSPKGIWMTGNENEFSNIYGRFLSDGLHVPSMWLTSIKKAIFRTSSGNGFWWDRDRVGGGTGQSGTSIDMTDCASFGNRGKGFFMQDCDYLTMSSCACDNSLEEAYIFQGCTGLNAHIAFEDADPTSTSSAIQLISGTNGTLTIDSFDSAATSKVGILASEAKVSIFGRLRMDYDTFILAGAGSIIDATGLSIQPLSGDDLDPSKFSVTDSDSIIYATEQSGDANRWNVHQFTSSGVNITQKAAYMSSLTLPGGTPSFIYGNSKLRVVYDVTDFNTTYNNTIVIPLSEIEKVIPNFSQASWAATPLELRITERTNIGVGEWVHIQGSALANNGQRSYTTMGSAIKVAVSGVAVTSGNLEITLDGSGGSRQRVSCELSPL